MAAPVVKGTSVVVGFPDGETVTGVIRDTYDRETTADIEYVRNENNEEATALVSNPGVRVVVDGVCTAAQTIAKGDQVTINSVIYLCEAATMRYAKTQARFSMTIYKPDGMTLS